MICKIEISNIHPTYKSQGQRHGACCPVPPPSLTKYYFKYERIVSPYGDNLGYEILLDFNKARNEMGDDVVQQYEKAINNGAALEFLIKTLIDNKRWIHAKRLFINIERVYLCNEQLLQKAVILAKNLHLKGIELVLEITERNPCGKCAKIDVGLQYLKSFGIALAADDFDIYSNDFRFGEVLSGVYDYIKIEVPTNESERKLFNDFILEISHMSKKVIIEKVEDPTLLNGLFTPFGIQGYAYGTKSPPLP
ncbi:EAL domain-containing protein [Aeromonas enteropelogenes]|uniref:EAL domain-containing protein n=1 Tax=Aeromonas enteropelogenes TaxID=29489 RepID=UPI0038CF3362